LRFSGGSPRRIRRFRVAAGGAPAAGRSVLGL